MKTNRFYFQKRECVIRERKKQKEKQKYFIWCLSDFKYISSLYDTEKENIKKFDYAGELFTLNLDDMNCKKLA